MLVEDWIEGVRASFVHRAAITSRVPRVYILLSDQSHGHTGPIRNVCVREADRDAGNYGRISWHLAMNLGVVHRLL